MVGGLVKLALLAGAGWYAYRKLAGGGSSATERDPFAQGGSAEAGGVGARVRESVSQAASAARRAAETVAGKAGTTVPGGRGADADRSAEAEPAEVRAAAMAGMPAVQPPGTIPEPELRAP